MNQEKLDEINNIGNQISDIEKFLVYMSRTPQRMHIFSKEPVKRRIIFRRPAYVFLERKEFTASEELETDLLNVLREHKDKLIARQEELWGGE